MKLHQLLASSALIHKHINSKCQGSLCCQWNAATGSKSCWLSWMFEASPAHQFSWPIYQPNLRPSIVYWWQSQELRLPRACFRHSHAEPQLPGLSASTS